MIFYVQATHFQQITSFQLEMQDLGKSACIIGAFMGRNYWVAGGVCGILDGADAIFRVTKTNFAKKAVFC